MEAAFKRRYLCIGTSRMFCLYIYCSHANMTCLLFVCGRISGLSFFICPIPELLSGTTPTQTRSGLAIRAYGFFSSSSDHTGFAPGARGSNCELICFLTRPPSRIVSFVLFLDVSRSAFVLKAGDPGHSAGSGLFSFFPSFAV